MTNDEAKTMKKRTKRKSRDRQPLTSPEQSTAVATMSDPRQKGSGNVNSTQRSSFAGSPLVSIQAAISTSLRDVEPPPAAKNVKGSNESNSNEQVKLWPRQRIKKPSKRQRMERTSCEKTSVGNLGSAETIEEQKARALIWVTEVLQKGIENVASEYKSLVNKPSAEKCEAYTKHMDFNRYDNMFCLEQTRVKVPKDGSGDDYLHANYVGLANPKNFICTQGPMDNTREKFWRMILNEGASTVVMLCELVERGEEKCSKYFPMEAHETMAIGAINVQCSGKTSLDHCGNVSITVRSLTVRLKEAALQVQHLNWNAWPDHGVPTSTVPMLRLLQTTRKSKGPIVVHCSAGVGRTGTLVTVALAQECFKKPSPFEGLLWLLKTIREQRAHVVQNEMQYAFVYKCVVDWVVFKGIVPWQSNEILDKFNKDYEQFLIQARKRKLARKPSREVIGSKEPL